MVIDAAHILFCEVDAPHTRRFPFWHPRDGGADRRGDTTGTATDSAIHPANIRVFYSGNLVCNLHISFDRVANEDDFKQICMRPFDIHRFNCMHE